MKITKGIKEKIGVVLCIIGALSLVGGLLALPMGINEETFWRIIFGGFVVFTASFGFFEYRY